MYLDGELQDEETLSDEVKAGYAASSNPPVFQAIEFNSSWVTNYREGNEFHGRLWNVSVCPRALTQEQIAYCYRGMSDRGLQLLNWYGGAYWAFDDGTGYIVSQTAGTDMGDIDFSHTTRVDDESSGAYVDADVSQYVQWKADSLNELSYEMRYKSLDRAERLANEAWREAAGGTSSQRAEALNNRAFCAFMRMDFERASALYRQASEASGNEVERLAADVGMMKICQRTSMNKEFYDYRNSARRRIRRINEDGQLLEGRLKKRMNYALSEFHIVSGIYYYYLEQDEEALDSIDSVPLSTLRGDRG